MSRGARLAWARTDPMDIRWWIVSDGRAARVQVLGVACFPPVTGNSEVDVGGRGTIDVVDE